jgi:hypothetical protein
MQTAKASLSITISAVSAGVACGNLSTGNLASLNGYVPFSSSSAWNTNIASAAVDPTSATIISALTGSNLHPDFDTPADGGDGIPYVVVDSNATPGVTVTMNGYPDESDITLYPIPLTAPPMATITFSFSTKRSAGFMKPGRLNSATAPGLPRTALSGT